MLEAALNVLLVEDNPADSRLIGDMLADASRRPVVITIAVRLSEALARLRTQSFSVVLLDLNLPDSEGLGTFTRLHGEAPRVPVVVFTGLADEAVAEMSVREGAQDYLVKGPITGAQLDQSIRYAIERHAVEEGLRASEERFSQLADNITEAFVMLELPGYRALYLSRMCAEILGRSLEEVYRDPRIWVEAIHPDDRESLRAAQRDIERGQPAAMVVRMFRADGSLRWVRTRAVPILDSERRVYRLVGIAEDITELRRTEELLFQAQKMEAVGQLAGGLAHDFNNLLTIVIGYSEAALSDLGPHPASEKVRRMRTAAESAATVTQQLLAFSRRQFLQPRNLDLNEVLTRVKPLLRRMVGEDIAVQMHLQTPLAHVDADLGQIEQVVINLVLNAVDAMPHGGRLDIETANAGDKVMIAVRDNGLGMDEATRNRLFEPFFTTKELGKDKGIGLGLAAVYGIVTQSQGSISVESELGHGSVFRIFLPPAATEATLS